jgi:hypothetical protein
MKKVILVSGRLQSGKNQFAQYLYEAYILNNISVSQDLFAKTLKNDCKEDFKPLTRDINENLVKIKSMVQEHQKYLVSIYPRHEKFYKEPFDNLYGLINDLLTTEKNFYEDKNIITRNLLQIYGTDIFRKRVDNNYWVKLLIDRVKKSEEDVTIVTDVRFPNEIELLNDDPDLYTIAIRIERDIDRKEKTNQHDSETALDDYKLFDYIVENNGTLEELWKSSDVIFEEIEELFNIKDER